MITLIGIAVVSVARHKVRAVLSGLSLVLGVLALTSVVAAQSVISASIVHDALLSGGKPTTSAIQLPDGADPLRTISQLGSYVHEVGTRGSTATVYFPSTILSLTAVGGQGSDLTVRVTDPSLTKVRPFDVVSGRWLSESKTLSPTVVLNEVAAQQYAGNFGWKLHWGHAGDGRPASIVGVVDDGEASPNAYISSSALSYIPYEDLGASPILLVHAPQWGLATTDSVASAFLEKTLSVKPVSVQRSDTVYKFKAQLGATTYVLSIIAAIALFVAAVGMLNIGLSTVKERSDELSLRRAFGASRVGILLLMLLEAQVIATLAATAGVALAYALMPVVLSLFGAPSNAVPALPVAVLGVGLVAGMLTALVASAVPAVRAMRVPIASIMRG